MGDLSTDAALERAAAANADYAGLCWRNTFGQDAARADDGSDAYPFWVGLTDAHRLSAIRAATVIVYAYLHYRSEKDPALEAERLLFLREVHPEWKPVLAKAMGITGADLAPRVTRKAFGADLSDPANDLFAFAWDQQASAGLLVEAFRREEIRRLEYKAHKMKSGGLAEVDIKADERWAARNLEILGVADAKVGLANEARQSAEMEHV